MGSKAGQQQETAAQRASTDHAVALLQDYKARWEPLQSHLASQIEAEGAPDSAARKLAAGKASTDTAMQFDQAGTQLSKSETNSGAAPGSGRADLAITGMGNDAAGSTGVGHMMSDQAVDDAYTQGLGALTSLGRGQSATVSSSLSSQAADSSAEAAADAKTSLMNRMGDAGIVGQVAGFGIQRATSAGFGQQTPPAAGMGGTGG